MKKILGYSLLVCMLLLGAGYYFFVPKLQLLTPEEQSQLKAGKTFWQWNSPHGSYAVHYIEKGSGSNHVIFIHGFRANSYTWSKILDPVAEAGYHVWSIDMLGCGFSDMPYSFPYHNDDLYVQQVFDFMKGKGIERAHFVGSSLGGGISLKMAIYNPDQVQSLALVAPLGYPMKLPTYLAVGKLLGQWMEPFLGREMVKKGLQHIMYDKNKVTEEQIEAYTIPYLLPGGAYASIETLRGYEQGKLVALSDRYKEIKVPLLVVWGDKDPLIPVAFYYRFIKDFPKAHRLLIPNSGHIPQEENPEDVRVALLHFLEQMPPVAITASP